MYSRWFNIAVVGLWLSTMTWLVVAKVLPSLLVGEPPSYSTIIETKQRDLPVGWQMTFNGRSLGWALSRTVPMANHLTEVRSRVHFDEIPLQDLTGGLGRLIQLPIPDMQMDVNSTLTIDSLGRLVRFDSAVQVDKFNNVIRLRGTVEDTQLSLAVRSGGFSYTTEAYLPPDALLSDALSPQPRLPGLRKGQTWTVPVYSPLRPPNHPMEVLHAAVEELDTIVFEGTAEDVWLVVYRTDPGFRLGKDDQPRGRLWVRPDGTVLRQEVMLLDSVMSFERLSDEKAVAVMQQIDSDRYRREPGREHWRGGFPRGPRRHHPGWRGRRRWRDGIEQLPPWPKAETPWVKAIIEEQREQAEQEQETDEPVEPGTPAIAKATITE